MMLDLPEIDGLFAALIDRKPLDECVLLVDSTRYSTPAQQAKGELYLLPSGQHTYKIPRLLPAEESFLFLQRLEEMIDKYSLDAVIIDTPPTMSDFDGPIFLAADAYVYMTQCEKMSLQGVMVAIEQMQRVAETRQRYLSRESKILGILPNLMRPNTLVHKNNVEALRERYAGLVWEPVIQRTMWVEANNANQPIFTYLPNGREAADAWTIVHRVEEGIC
jgi:cellulose biosynthesis protein BcsQ